MTFVPFALYGAAFAAYVWHFATRNAAVGRSATTLLVAAALAHTFAIGMETTRIGDGPVTRTCPICGVSKIGRAHVLTPVNLENPMPAFALKKKKYSKKLSFVPITARHAPTLI